MQKWAAARLTSAAPSPSIKRRITKNQAFAWFQCAGGGTRTHKPLRTIDFESIASASFATPAFVGGSAAFPAEITRQY